MSPPLRPLSTLFIRKDRRAGRITLTKPQALNALDPQMSHAIESALLTWQEDPEVELIVLDAEGDRAFCAGGDIAAIYHAARAGNPDFAADFWRQEYRLNLRLALYPKPIVSLMQGFVMGGGVGLGCHVSHRIVGETAQIAMPECGIGLVPDVGGTHLLARAPGRIGAFVALTAARMGLSDALYCGFADYYVPITLWPRLIERLCEEGQPELIAEFAAPAPPAPLRDQLQDINQLFAADNPLDILNTLENSQHELAQKAAPLLRRHAPLSMGCTLALLKAAHDAQDGVEGALRREFRYTARAIAQGDFLEGIRAQIIDKDRQPKWQHATLEALTAADIAAMLADLGAEELDLGGIP